MTAAIQFDWIEQLVPFAPEDLAAVDDLLGHFPDYSTGVPALIRASLLDYRAALLGQFHSGAAIPVDVRFHESYTAYKLDIAGRPAQCHTWAISDSFMAMAGGQGATPAQARARSMVGLMLSINEAAAECQL